MHFICKSPLPFAVTKQEGEESNSTACAGGKKREDIYEAFESIYPVLQEFRKGEAVPSAPALPSTVPARALPVRHTPLHPVENRSQLCMQQCKCLHVNLP